MKIEFKFTNSQHGGIELFLLGIIVIGAFFLVGGVGVFKKTPATDSVSATKVVCCDSGNGDSCKPLTGPNQTITYEGKQYGLLRSQTEFVEGNLHLRNSNSFAKINGQDYPIILNTSNFDDNFAGLPGACKNDGTDKYLTEKPANIGINDIRILQYCTQIPNDQIIYVCKENCAEATTCNTAGYTSGQIPTCYGDDTTVYDAYFRIPDYEATGVPDFIKNCKQQTAPKALDADERAPQTLVIPSNTKHDNLQLNTFGVTEPGNQSIPWFSPYCKPAIYLYPEKETNVSVEVNPVGPFTYTTPLYTPGGWSVSAYPDGTIISNGKKFPYLYYEADIPSILIPKPEEGFSVHGSQIGTFLNDLLPKLGLNAKETQEMTVYWQNALPNSPYYFIGVIPEKVLDSIAPLTINPKPNKTIRISLYFEEKNNFEKVIAPTLENRARTGFTAVEWGGILKTDKPFVCLQ